MSGTAPLLLLSMPQMKDPNFAKSVVLLCEYTDKGAFGLVVNRPMSEPAWTLVKTEPPIKVDPDLKLWIGGPVEPQRTWVLMADSHGLDEEEAEICPGVLLSVSHQLTLQILQSPPSPRTRVIIGYAGWGPGQLENEIAASGWLTMEVDAGLIFNTPADQMWEAAIRRLGADPSALQTSSGVH
jgi:putative transcriptional regulator